MKRNKPMALAALCCFSLLAGCGQNAAAGTAPAAGQSQPPAPEGQSFSIEDRLETGSFTITYTAPESGEETQYLFGEYDYRLPRMVPADEAGAGVVKAAEVFNAKVNDYLQKSLAAMKEAADFEQQEPLGPHQPYSDEAGYQLYQTPNLISVQVNFGSYYGGAHPNHASLSWLFDVENAQFITPLDLAADPEAMETAITEEILAQIQQKELAEGLWPEYQDIAAGWAGQSGANASFIHGEGLTLTFSPYTLASYAAGDQIFEIPSAIYQPLLSDYGLSLLQLN
ncbi:MAG: DUF3298 and DUF4163 domain-containing protein [Peptococcaceae bacterium]|nr:DUF3298 and DUF4163 domain-containing protein [Peptococcaceae bacterium]